MMNIKTAYAVMEIEMGGYSEVVIVCEHKADANRIEEEMNNLSKEDFVYKVKPVKFKPREIW